VIAAGRGERLRPAQETLKPLVRIAGETLIDRVLTSIAEVEPDDVVAIVNEDSGAVRELASKRNWPFPLRWIVETTPSSMHSFLRVLETLAAGGSNGPFLVSTVDTVAVPGAYARFAAASERLDADAALAVVPVPGDDRPLLVRMAEDGRVMDIGFTATQDDYSAPNVRATAGYYAVRASVLREADGARADGLTALRLFFERLVRRGYRVHAVPVTASVDVDRPGDIAAAEVALRQVRG
jgi:NDP-sugar pyrophosphorylase family protein